MSMYSATSADCVSMYHAMVPLGNRPGKTKTALCMYNSLQICLWSSIYFNDAFGLNSRKIDQASQEHIKESKMFTVRRLNLEE